MPIDWGIVIAVRITRPFELLIRLLCVIFSTFFSSRSENLRYSNTRVSLRDEIWDKALSPHARIAGFDQKEMFTWTRRYYNSSRAVVVLCAWRWTPLFFLSLCLFLFISTSFPGNTRRDELKLDQKGMRSRGDGPGERVSRAYRLSFISARVYSMAARWWARCRI